MPGEDLILSEANRAKLDGIVSKMSQNKESDENIRFVVEDFKQKYGEKKNSQTQAQTDIPSLSGSQLESIVGASDSDVGDLGQPQMNYLQGNITPGIPLQPQKTLVQPLAVPSEASLRAATSPMETTAKDQINFDTEIDKKLDGPGVTESLARGGTSLVSNVLKSPAFVWDVMASGVNSIANPGSEHLPERIRRELDVIPNSDEISKKTGIKNTISQELDQAVNFSRERQAQKYDKGITESFAAGEYDKGFGLLANSVAETVPVTLSLMAGNAAGLSTLGSIGAGTAVFGAGKNKELQEQSPQMSEEDRLTNATLTGAFEGIFEQFGITKLGGLAKDVLKSEGKDAAKQIAKEGFVKTYLPIMKRYFGVSAQEMASEAATQFAENVTDKYTGADPNKDLMAGVSDAALIALASSGAHSGPIAAMEVVKTKKALKQASELADQKKALENDLQSPDVSQAAKPAIAKKIQDINEQEADLAAEEKEKYNSLSEEGKKQVDALLDKSRSIAEAAVDPAISEETKEVLKKEMDGIDKEIDKVYESASQEKEKVVKQEESDELEYLRELRSSFGLEEKELARLIELESAMPAVQVEPEAVNIPDVTENVETEQQPAVQEEPVSEDVIEVSQPEAIPQEEAPAEVETINQEQNAQETQNQNNQAEVLTPETETDQGPVEKQKLSNELMDEEEVDDVKDSQEAKMALDKDLETMKLMKTQDLAEKKFVGMIERAWKAKEEGKISRPTYTAFRNKAKDILEGKVRAKDGVDATEAKLRSTAAINKVKEKLLGQGYKKVYLSTFDKINPVSVAKNIKSNRDILKRLDTLKDAPNSDVLSYLKSINQDKTIDPVISVMLKNSNRIPESSFKGVEFSLGIGGKYYPNSGNIFISSELLVSSPNEIAKALAHEFVHAFTVSALVNPQTRADEVFRDEIKSIYDYIKTNTKFDTQYGFTNEKEFVSELMTNKEFVNNIKNNPTLFERILQAIFDFFGLGKIETKNGKLKSEYLVKRAQEIVLEFIPESNYDNSNSQSEPLFKNQTDDLLNITNNLIHRGIDAGFSVQESTQKALNIVKKHPLYKKLLRDQQLDEKAFETSVNESMATKKPEKKAAERKTAEDTGAQPSEISGELRKKKTVARLKESERLKDIADQMDPGEEFYVSVNANKARAHINDVLNEYEKNGLLVDLAEEMIDGESPFHPKINQWAAARLADRLNVIAKKDGNEMQRSAMNALAGKLWNMRSNAVNLAATITGLESEVAKELPLSEEGLKAIVDASIDQIQDTYLEDKQKVDIATFQKAVKEAVDAEINRVAELTKSAEWVKSVDDAIDGLKIDLTDC